MYISHSRQLQSVLTADNVKYAELFACASFAFASTTELRVSLAIASIFETSGRTAFRNTTSGVCAAPLVFVAFAASLQETRKQRLRQSRGDCTSVLRARATQSARVVRTTHVASVRRVHQPVMRR